MREINFGLYYELRNPQFPERTAEDLTEAVIEQVVRAEELGFSTFWSSEHHFTDDGETASPFMLASAIAARTKTIRIGMNLVVLPLHNPLRLAEDAAMLGILSRGRFDLGVAAGYEEITFDAFGAKLSHRPSLMEEGLSVIQQAFAGKPFKHSGKRWDFPELTISPLPQPENMPKVWVGGYVEAAVERAVRFGEGFLAADLGVVATYLDLLEKAGKPKESGKVATTLWWVIAEDPEKTWSEIGKHGLHQLNKYIAAGLFGDRPLIQDPQELLDEGHYEIHDGPSAVKRLNGLLDEYPNLVEVSQFALLPGEEVDSGAERMEYVAKSVLPHFKPSTR